MKFQTLAFLCALFVFNSSTAQEGTIEYSPGIYEEYKSYFNSKSVQDRINTKGKKSKDQEVIESDYIKFMALSPSGKLQKIDEIGKCLASNKRITSSELKTLRVLFENLKSNNEKAAIASARKIIETDAKSSVMSDILNTLRNDDQNQYQTQFDVNDAADVIVFGSTVAGGFLGGKHGAKVGKASGKVSGGMLKKIHNWLFGGGDGFMPGPNGEGCEPPYLNF